MGFSVNQLLLKKLQRMLPAFTSFTSILHSWKGRDRQDIKAIMVGTRLSFLPVVSHNSFGNKPYNRLILEKRVSLYCPQIPCQISCYGFPSHTNQLGIFFIFLFLKNCISFYIPTPNPPPSLLLSPTSSPPALYSSEG